jgi:hypothetical protein
MIKSDKKKTKIMMKKIFTKDELLKYKKYDRLLAYNIPYAVINRAYNRYLENIEDYILYRGYPSEWFKKDSITFCRAVKSYIIARKENHKFKFGTMGYTSIEIIKVSGISKYIDHNIDQM